jgi:hypothetical protein
MEGMMSEKELIEEIVKIICPYRADDGKCTCNQHQFGVRKCADPCAHRDIAEQVVDAGYAPVAHGEWKFIDHDETGYEVECTHCGTHYTFPSKAHLTKHCPECGAKMDGGAHEKNNC